MYDITVLTFLIPSAHSAYRVMFIYHMVRIIRFFKSDFIINTTMFWIKPTDMSVQYLRLYYMKIFNSTVPLQGQYLDTNLWKMEKLMIAWKWSLFVPNKYDIDSLEFPNGTLLFISIEWIRIPSPSGKIILLFSSQEKLGNLRKMPQIREKSLNFGCLVHHAYP